MNQQTYLLPAVQIANTGVKQMCVCVLWNLSNTNPPQLLYLCWKKKEKKKEKEKKSCSGA